MAIKLAHISDLHYGSRDVDAADGVLGVLKAERPNYLVVTGDLANNPWSLPPARGWVEELVKTCSLDAANVLVVAGNHDYRIVGNFGFKPVGSWFFRRSFAKWWYGNGFYFPPAFPKLAFLVIDSNPICLGFARGRFGYFQSWQLKRQLKRLSKEERERLRAATVIAVLHHHPLPVPHGGSNFFLVLRNLQNLLKFLAENEADIVLHGHKHQATYSALSIATSAGTHRRLHVLGAGTCMKIDDHDPRGYNLNLITLEESGLRYVRQFFAQPKAPFEEAPRGQFVVEALDDAYDQWQKRKGFTISKLHWDLIADYEGDRRNEFEYAGVVAAPGQTVEQVQLPSFTLDTGHFSEPALVDGAPAVQLEVTPHDHEREVELKVRFTRNPTAKKPVGFRIRSWDYNAFSLDREDFRRKFPARVAAAPGTFEEWEEKEIREPVRHFSWTLTFPGAFEFPYAPRFEVFDESGATRHEWLTEILQGCFHYAEGTKTAFLKIDKPPAGYRYRLTWPVPERDASHGPVNPVHKAAADALITGLLAARDRARAGSSDREVLASLAAFNILLNQFLRERLNAPSLPDRDFDVNFMVLDARRREAPPVLRFVATVGPMSGNRQYWDFWLEIGDGNAGRAYRKNIIRYYHRDRAAGDPKKYTYVKVPGMDRHSILFSIPLRHPKSPDLICCILNVGAFNDEDGSFLASLNDDQGNAWLVRAGHEFLLTQLASLLSISME
jgi:predicted phosphodiesterase